MSGFQTKKYMIQPAEGYGPAQVIEATYAEVVDGALYLWKEQKAQDRECVTSWPAGGWLGCFIAYLTPEA